MVTAVDKSVEFEISIGNYGNKLDETVAPCSSTTQPTNPVFDGSHYYFLPWGETKPCCVVDCHWEDVCWRLKALNQVLYILRRLRLAIDHIETAIQANKPVQEQRQLVTHARDQLMQDAKKPLPVATDQPTTELDRQLADQRASELKELVQEASNVQVNTTEPSDAVREFQGMAGRLENLAVEPQNSLPDAIIWLLAGDKRTAYYRCPAHKLLWSEEPSQRGELCGGLQTIQLRYPGDKAARENRWEIPAQVRVRLWLGLKKDEQEWHRLQTDGQLAVFAETYENQMSILGNWTTKGPMGRPDWSDVTGKLELEKSSFVPPPGWEWDGDWYMNPELSMLYDKDAGHTTFLEDIYECESRLPGCQWGASTPPWADVKGDPMTGLDEIVLPSGWQWTDDNWKVDRHRAVDEEGWEYAMEATLGGYGAVEKRYHLCRRRRWLRQRQLVKPESVQKKEEKRKKEMQEGWEYAPLFNMQFHYKERKMDLVRRRRWHRKMVCTGDKTSCFFELKGKKDKEQYNVAMTAPRLFLTCPAPQQYQLRAYMYQARGILAADSSGLADPFLRVVFLNHSQKSEKVHQSLCPTWDQTLVYECVNIHGDSKGIAANPPQITVEVFDYDKFGASEFLGRATAYPLVKLDPSDETSAELQWLKLYKGDSEVGELLAAFELFLVNGQDLPFLPPKRDDVYMVPGGIRPLLQRTAVEVMCWGVRNMKKFQLASVSSPSVSIEIGGQIQESAPIKNTKKNPNFDAPTMYLELNLPQKELYTPPLNIQVYDQRPFGRKPLVGVQSVTKLESFRCDPHKITDLTALPSQADGVRAAGPSKNGVVLELQEDQTTSERDIDWWSKFYSSTGELDKCKDYVKLGYDTIQVYDCELERVATFKGFNDFCHTFNLQRGPAQDEEDADSSAVGQFKGTFRIYPLPEDRSEPDPPRVLHQLPSSNPEECIVRVYVIQGLELQPSDSSGLADPYISVSLGKKTIDDSDCYVANSLNPVFGRVYELKGMLPVDKDLTVTVKDYDLIGSDDVIGSTQIDLENRYLSAHRATVGLSKSYCRSGMCAWRDSQTPQQLLEAFCVQHKLPAPLYSSNTEVKIGQQLFQLAKLEPHPPKHGNLGEASQRLALAVLHQVSSAAGYPVVPEHIETRPLYSALRPDIEQGRLQMWVDVFPLSLGTPGPAVDISPRAPNKYELRVIVWNTKDVVLDETSITGESMSDIFVKGWLDGLDEDKQETDVHYRSMDGEGNFNWRFVFPFEYIAAEDLMVLKKKDHFWSLDETERRVPAKLNLQIWDNDLISADDYLGTLELPLARMPKPTKKSSKCSLDQLNGPTLDIFQQKRARGYWPCFNIENDNTTLAGKLELELELVTESEGREKPAGHGQEEPNQHPKLDPPKRPETSFLFITSPLKSLKFIVWRNYKWHFLIGLLIFLLIIFIILFIYAVPGSFVDWLFGN